MNAPAPAVLPQGLAPRPAPELSVVVPVFRHADGVAAIVEKLRSADPNGDWEIVFVDDNSPDDTVAAVRALGARDPRVRVPDFSQHDGDRRVLKRVIAAYSADRSSKHPISDLKSV